VLNDLVQLQPLGARRDANLFFGDLLHQGTAQYWRNLMDDEGFPKGDPLRSLQTAIALTDQLWTKGATDVNWTDRSAYMTQDLLNVMLEEYAKAARIGGDIHSDWRILELEERHDMVIWDRTKTICALLSYQTDRLLESADGTERAIVDTKSASSLGDRWRRSLEQSIQQRLYAYLEEDRLGAPIDYVIVEGISKKSPIGALEYAWLNMTWDHDYLTEAKELALHEAGLDTSFVRALGEDFQWEDALRVAIREPMVASFNTMDCQSYFRTCEYESICFANPDERFGIAMGDFQYAPKDY
jgi:hypothetical protein